MKRLFLMRHAKTESAQPRESDHARELLPRGKEDAKRIAQELCARQLVPDVIASSDAVRAVQTADIVVTALAQSHLAVSWQQDHNFYSGGVEELMELVALYGGDNQSLMVVAHNPHLHVLAQQLAARAVDPHPAIAQLSQKFRPASCAIFDSDGENWWDFFTSPVKLHDFLSPQR